MCVRVRSYPAALPPYDDRPSIFRLYYNSGIANIRGTNLSYNQNRYSTLLLHPLSLHKVTPPIGCLFRLWHGINSVILL